MRKFIINVFIEGEIDKKDELICYGIKELQYTIKKLYELNEDVNFNVTYRNHIIPTIDSESKFKGYDKEKECINTYCDMTDSIMGMEGCEE